MRCVFRFFLLTFAEKQNLMLEKEFDFVIYPLKLVVTIGMDYETLCNRFECVEPGSGERWGDESDFQKTDSYISLVKDKNDDNYYKILWNFESSDVMTMNIICHESFHVAISVCNHLNMALGFNSGQDEHAAYIAGFAGDCASKMFGLLEEKKEDKENG